MLGVFHGEADLDVLQAMMQWEPGDVAGLAAELIQTGLATPAPYNHLRLDPALCPYLRARLAPDQRQELETRWLEAMRAFAGFLTQQRFQNAQLAATLTHRPAACVVPSLVPRLAPGAPPCRSNATRGPSVS